MIREFRAFILRGNLVDLAVAVVIGAAFTAVVSAFVTDLMTPLIAAIGGQSDFSALTFEINGSRFLYGDFINALLTFVIVAAVVFFFVVKPVNALLDRLQTESRWRRRRASARNASPGSRCARSGAASARGRSRRAARERPDVRPPGASFPMKVPAHWSPCDHQAGRFA